MLQREKEIMKEAIAQKVGSPSTSVESLRVSSPVTIVAATNKVITPTPRISSSPPIHAVVVERVASPEIDRCIFFSKIKLLNIHLIELA